MNRDLRLRYPQGTIRCAVRARRGALASLGAWIRSTTTSRRAALVTDSRVAALYAGTALRALRRGGVAAEAIVIPRGERAKRPVHLVKLWQAFDDFGLRRGDLVIALGGGVVGDLAGFAAATWMRGVAWVDVPTTVVAQVDSSIGGKTGIDLPSGKNLAGAFHHASGVLVDTDLLLTLPASEYRSGMAEVVKAGFATDAALFRSLERAIEPLAARAPEILAAVVWAAIRAKARVVQADERERGGRAALNFGHTLGHALEAALGYRGLRHGEAVAIGMRFAAELSARRAGLDPGAARRLDSLLDAWRLPRRVPRVPMAKILGALDRDKKRRDARVRWVLTPRVGHASVPRLIPTRIVKAVLLEFGATV